VYLGFGAKDIEPCVCSQMSCIPEPCLISLSHLDTAPYGRIQRHEMLYVYLLPCTESHLHKGTTCRHAIIRPMRSSSTMKCPQTTTKLTNQYAPISVRPPQVATEKVKQWLACSSSPPFFSTAADCPEQRCQPGQHNLGLLRHSTVYHQDDILVQHSRLNHTAAASTLPRDLP
jgi:hypothetical protein